MRRFGGWMRLAAAALTALIAGTALIAQTGGVLTALGKLQPGLWHLRDLDDRDARPQSICVTDPNILMQVQHRYSPCSRIVIANSEDSATVHYTCPSQGFGRTTLRVETPRLVQIDTQGISSNLPFAYRLEARWGGSCPREGRNAR